MTPDYTYRAALTRVVDGDTLILRIDLGFRTSCEQSIRLVGVNAPEMFSGTNREVGAEAKGDCLEWLLGHGDATAVWPFIVRTEKDRTTFGRYLGWVTDLAGNSLNGHLMALPWQEDHA